MKTVLHILLIFAVWFSTAKAEINPLSRSEVKVIDSIMKESDPGLSRKEIVQRRTNFNNLFFQLDKYVLVNPRLVDLLSRAAYFAASNSEKRVAVLHKRVTNELSLLDTNLITVIRKLSARDMEPLETISDTNLQKITHFIKLNYNPALERPAFLWTLDAFKESYHDTLKARRFVAAYFDLFFEMYKDAFNLEQETVITCSDLAVELVKNGYSPMKIRHLTFSKEDEEIIAFGLEKNPSDPLLNLFKGVLVPYPFIKEKYQWDNYYHTVFYKKKNLFNYRYNDSFPSLSKEEKLKRISSIELAIKLDTTLKSALMHVGDLYDSVGYKDSALHAYTEVLNVSPYTTPASGGGWEQIQLKRFSLMGDLKKHEELLQLYQELRTHLPDLHERNIYMSIPYAYIEKEAYDSASFYLYDSVKIEKYFDESESYKLDWHWGVEISWVALLAGRYDKVREVENHYDKGNFRHVFNLADPDPKYNRDSVNFAMSLANIGHSYHAQRNKEKALLYYTRSRDIYNRHYHEDNDSAFASFQSWMRDDFEVLPKKSCELPFVDFMKKELEFSEKQTK